ncbi:LytR/AlgR family response regulator transcription factor [Cloacibacterium sp.]|uniref:LytR/AlgR family response regulator transcription factor n=1 Tax=Cloacibacterium sp. TaxID=1913682 RepID=UPI0039E3577C
MKIVIIEDEKLMAKDLSQTLQKIDATIEIVAVLSSVEDSLVYLSKNEDVDLIFSDIELEDGLSFEIFERLKLNIPIIFCTAYNEYALQAFRANGVEYILKPFNENVLQKSLEKLENLKQSFQKKLHHEYKASLDALESYRKRENNIFMLKYRNQILPISFDKIALIFKEDELTYIYTDNERLYTIPYKLEEMEKKAGAGFFRVNRQFLVNRNSVKEINNYNNRKLKILFDFPFEKEVLVSKEKSPKFLKWLEEI